MIAEDLLTLQRVLCRQSARIEALAAEMAAGDTRATRRKHVRELVRDGHHPMLRSCDSL